MLKIQNGKETAMSQDMTFQLIRMTQKFESEFQPELV